VDGVLLGTGRRLAVELGPQARLIARLPYDVESISFHVEERRTGGGRRAAGTEILFRAVVETSALATATHVLHQEVRNEDGRVVPGSTATLVARRGVARGRVVLAPNEPAGEYAVSVTDAATGLEAQFTVRKRTSQLEKRFPVAEEAGSAPARGADR
jgi:hypothetical protein